MADDEEPFILDSQEERELLAQVCQLAAEVTLQQFLSNQSNHKCTCIICIHTYIRCSKLHVLMPMCKVTYETWTDRLSEYDISTEIRGII